VTGVGSTLSSTQQFPFDFDKAGAINTRCLSPRADRCTTPCTLPRTRLSLILFCVSASFCFFQRHRQCLDIPRWSSGTIWREGRRALRACRRDANCDEIEIPLCFRSAKLIVALCRRLRKLVLVQARVPRWREASTPACSTGHTQRRWYIIFLHYDARLDSQLCERRRAAEMRSVKE
jgi:hypothetical protein